MQNWVNDFKESSAETKKFIFTIIIFLLIIFVATGYSYIRLDAHRSYDKSSQKSESKL